MKNNFKILVSLIILIIIFSINFSFAVAPKVQINGEIVDFTDSNGQIVEAQIINDRTMVPLRKIFEVLGCELDWEDATKTVTAKKESKIITLQIGNSIAKVSNLTSSNEEEITLDSPPVIVEGRTLVPLRFIAESLEKDVGWDSTSSTAIIIDYDFFVNLIKEKDNNLYNILESKNSKTTFTKTYIDNLTNDQTDTSVAITATSNNDSYKIDLNVKGNSDLAKEIEEEKWHQSSFEISTSGDNINIKNSSEVFEKILKEDLNINGIIIPSKLGLNGSINDSLSTTIKMLFNISPNKFNEDTFSKMKSDFSRLLDTLLTNSKTIDNNDVSFNHIKLSNLYEIIGKNASFDTLLILNKLMFGYSYPDMYDFFDEYTKVTYSSSKQSNSITFKIQLLNDYKETFIYSIELSTK